MAINCLRRVALADALKVLCRRKCDRRAAIGDGEERDLFAFEQLFDHDVAPECGGSVKTGIQLLLRVADEDALARRKPVCLHDARWASDGEPSGGRHTRGLEHVLRESLRALDSGGGGSRPEHRHARPAKRVDEADDQWRLRPNDDQVDVELAAERQEALAVLGADRVTFAEIRDAGVPGRGVEGFQARALAQLPRECVLASP